jgi:hypothetical protein
MIHRRTTNEDVRWCYRILLGREPESLEIISNAVRDFPFLMDYVENILHSEEYLDKKSLYNKYKKK